MITCMLDAHGQQYAFRVKDWLDFILKIDSIIKLHRELDENEKVEIKEFDDNELELVKEKIE